MFDLTGKNVLVTGASGGIGEVMAALNSKQAALNRLLSCTIVGFAET